MAQAAVPIAPGQVSDGLVRLVLDDSGEGVELPAEFRRGLFHHAAIGFLNLLVVGEEPVKGCQNPVELRQLVQDSRPGILIRCFSECFRIRLGGLSRLSLNGQFSRRATPGPRIDSFPSNFLVSQSP